MKRSLAVVLLSLVPLWTLAAAPPVHGIEVAFGADNIAAVTGNGGLTVGVSRDGDLTVLSWPSPTFWDHLHYLTRNGVGARDLPRMGAAEGAGAFVGLVVRQGDEAPVEVVWLRDQEREVGYTAGDTGVVQARFTSEALGLTVLQYDLVPADVDALVRHLVVERTADSPVTEAWVLGYANLSPNVSRLPEVPVVDFLLDHKNDFLAVWHPDEEAIVHFHPGDTGSASSLLEVLTIQDRDFGPLGPELAASPLDEDAVATLARDLDDHYGAGVAVALASSPPPDQHQVGADTTDTCAALDQWADTVAGLDELFGEFALALPAEALSLVRCGDFQPLATPVSEEGWLWVPEDALTDAADGELGLSPLAGAQVNTALRVPLTFTGGQAEASLYFAFGATAGGALTTLGKARQADPSALRQTLEADARSFLASLNLPEAASEELLALARRTFLALRSGIDRESGALVASISRQPPYHLDWPRDGVFFNVALDLAGLTDLVTKRLDFYAGVIRTEDATPLPLVDGTLPGWPGCPDCTAFPAGSWEMNYYADGTVGGNIRLEIDNTALLVWGYAAHAGFLPEADRQGWIERVWPTVKAAADFLEGWRDDETGLVWPANEDDNFAFTQGLQGAVTVYGALAGAAMLAGSVADTEARGRYVARARELHGAILTHLHDEEAGFLTHPATDDPAAEKRPNRGGPLAWIGWPARVLPWSDERLRTQLAEALPKAVAVAQGEGPGGSYLTKVAISAALVFGADSPEGQQALAIAQAMAADVADPLTHHLGEVFRNLDTDGDGQTDARQNAVAPPHLWAMTLVYLTAMAVHEPESFDPHLEVLPRPDLPGYEPDPAEPQNPEPTTAEPTGAEPTADAGPAPTSPAGDDSGCSASATSPRSAPLGWLLLLLLLVASATRRSRA